jgi:hypothetical protein
MKIAILDDYQNAALDMADWCEVARQARIMVFHETLSDPDALRLQAKRERCAGPSRRG